ncbi:MAG: SAM-dependent methyltransferase, partial [Bosea sp. (in: a-proteobacteria)]
AETLGGSSIAPIWHERIETALSGPVILIANEFLDALPIRQYQRQGGAWHERLVGLDAQDRLMFGLHPQAALADAPDHAPDGTIIERAEMAEGITADAARHIAAQGGAALLIDYGAAQSGTGDTLQAVMGHRFVDVFERPGEADLTVQVDFERMAKAANKAGAAVQPITTQAAFLDALGITKRAERLCAKATPDQAASILGGVARLTDISIDTAMGSLFKVLCIRAPTLPPLPGLPT